MADLDPDQLRGLTVLALIMAALAIMVLAAVWQSWHCVFCNQMLSWRAVKAMKYACDNRGDCNLANLVKRARSGDI